MAREPLGPASLSCIYMVFPPYGSIAYQYGLQIDRRAKSLGLYAEVFDAEAAGALEGARGALTSPGAKLVTDLWVFLDNLEVAYRLLSPFVGSS
jgi:hypothetical protein